MLATDGGGNATTAAGSEESSTNGLEMMTAENAVSSHPLYRAGQYVWYVVPPVILLFGNFGNVMTIVIMRRMRSSGEAVINIYFVALAVMDLVTLDVLFLLDWVGITFGYFVHYQSDITCKLHNWSVGPTTMGGWVLVSLTAHRALSVIWPHRVGALCTRRRVKGLMAALVVFFTGVYSHYLYGYRLEYSRESGTYVCTMRVGSYAAFVAEVFSYVDLLLYSLLPFAAIFLANAVLVRRLRATVRDVRGMISAGGSSGAEQAREKAATSVTVTIVLVSATYVLLTLPVAVYYVSLFIYDPSAVATTSEVAESYLTRAVTFMLMYCNSAVNFYLYCLTGRKFRKEFVKIMFCCCSSP